MSEYKELKTNMGKVYGSMVSDSIERDNYSTYYDIKKFNQYIDTLKVVRPTAQQMLLRQIYLNSWYGMIMENIKFKDNSKQNNVSYRKEIK